jgi:hypothetical protein
LSSKKPSFVKTENSTHNVIRRKEALFLDKKKSGFQFEVFCSRIKQKKEKSVGNHQIGKNKNFWLLRKNGGDDRIRTCEGLLTPNGLANRRFQPLSHVSALIKKYFQITNPVSNFN